KRKILRSRNMGLRPLRKLRVGKERRTTVSGRDLRKNLVKLATLASWLVGIATLLSVPGTTFASPETHCRTVVGKLLNEHLEDSIWVAQMTGAVKGKYIYTFRDQFPADAVLSNLLYTTGTSVVETQDGTLSFFETSTQDADDLSDLNATVLMTIT